MIRIDRMVSSPRRLILGLALGVCFLIGAANAASPGQRDFATAADAAKALVDAARADDTKALLAVLGNSAQSLITSGDPVQDKNSRASFAADYDAKQSLQPAGPGRMVLTIGQNDWPLPIPIVEAGGRWSFDTDAGAQELINRRVGKNELLTIRTMLALSAAEQDYFERFKAGTGTGAFAQRVMSSPDKTDGLYWEVGQGEVPSPLGPLVDTAVDEGYPDATTAGGKPVVYHGYYYRMLKAQGGNAPGGAKDYMQNGQMAGGFAFVAWPAQYGSSGVVTFIVGPDGVVYQKDLGAATARTAAAMTRFDPDITWARIDIAD